MPTAKLYNRKDGQWRLRLGNSLYLLLSFYKGELVVGLRICDETAGDDNFAPATKEGVNNSVAQFHEFMKVYKKAVRIFEDNGRQCGVFVPIDEDESMAFNMEKIDGEVKYSIVHLAEQKNGEKFVPRKQGALRVNFDDYQMAVLEREYATIREKIKELDDTTIISKPRFAATATAATASETAEEKKKNIDFHRWAVRDVLLRKVMENGKLDDPTDAAATVSNIIADTTVHELIFRLSKHHGKALTKTNPTWDELEKTVKHAIYGRTAIADTIKQLKQNRDGGALFGGGCIVDDGGDDHSSAKSIKLSPGDSEPTPVSLKRQHAMTKAAGSSSKKSIKIRPDPESDEEDINIVDTDTPPASPLTDDDDDDDTYRNGR